MARARNIKPSLFKNELLGVADPMLTILFTSLWCLADKAGILEDRPLRIKAETFPYREGLDINGYLTELQRLGFIHRYVVDKLPLIQVINFLKHQNPHKTEKESIYQEYSEESSTCALTVIQPLNNGSRPADSLIPDSLNPIKPLSGKNQPASRFLEFWAVWPKSPRKVDKQKCEKKWNAKKLDLIADQIIAHVIEIKKTKQWIDGFEPAPMTYLNGGRWCDEIFTDADKTSTKAWYISNTGIEAKGKEMNVEKLKDEQFPNYKMRVYKAAGITHEMVRVALLDFDKKAA
jgi:hypothetical protein